MRVFVAGATGAIGRRLVPMLVEAGHDVTGMTRSDSKVDALRGAAAEPVVCDALDADAVRDAVAAAAPEVVVHQLTAIPHALNPRRMADDFAATNRLRSEGTRHLADAARSAGARRLVAQGVAFAYAPYGGWMKTEDDELYVDAPAPFDSTFGALHTLETAVLGTDGLEGVVLRYGYFYGPGTSFAADGSIAGEVRARRFPIGGRGTGRWSFIHIDDAARATVAAVEGGPPGAYNVVDDEPAPVSEWLPVYAAALGAPRPRRLPAWLVRLAAGRYAVYGMTQARGASNARARERLGWTPRLASWRQGFAESLKQALSARG
jgi:nucleoside-diphosphate-sugar epimerase